MPATLRSLSDQAAFGLRVVVDGSQPDSLDQPIPWAHSTDLPDPTPWLEAGQLLLTNGAQFSSDPTEADTTAYVDRLAKSGLGGLGFATQVVHPTVPPQLVRACEQVGLPLLEVRARSPFIAIIKYVADQIASDERRRLEWFLSAQRALARAALRPDGLAAVLHELQRRLDCWVILFDATGAKVRVPTLQAAPVEVRADVTQAVRTALSRGLRTGMRLSTANSDITLQTIGQRGQLRGVLVVGSATPLDAAGTNLMASVIALASISVEQTRTLQEARGHLRSGLVELLLAGSVDVARSTAARVGDNLPDAPIRVALFGSGAQNDHARRDLERDGHPGQRPWFIAQRAGLHVVTVATAATDDLIALLTRHGVRAGISGVGSWAELASLLDEGERALRRSSAHVPIARFETMHGQGFLGLIEQQGGAEVSHRLLAPLHTHPEGRVLAETLIAWFDAGCAWDPAARTLGVHRHTLRNRVRTVEQLLGIDTESFAGRTELWVALQFDHSWSPQADRTPDPSRSGDSP